MISTLFAVVARQLREYRDALQGFGHNARRFVISGFIQGLGGGMLVTVFTIYLKEAGLRESVIGDAEAAVALAAALVALLGAPLIASFGYRSLMVGAVVVLVASRLGMAYLPAAAAVIGFSFAVGIGDGFLRAVGAAFISENSEGNERAHLYSFEFIARVCAGLFGGLAGGQLPTLLQRWTSEVASYQWTIGAAALLVGAAAMPLMSLREHGRPRVPVRQAYAGSLSVLRSWRHLSKLVVPQAAIALGGGMVIPFVPLYLKSSLHASIGQIGTILGLSAIVTSLGVFGTPVIARRLGLPAGVALLQALSVPFLALVSMAHSLPVVVAALWVRSALMNMAGPMYNQLAMESVSDAEKPVMSGWMFFGLNMMWLVGSVMGGRLMEVSYVLPYTVAVVLYLGGAATTYLWWGGSAARSKLRLRPATQAG